MENFQQKFLEEAVEHISTIEQALLTLEDNPEDKDLIEKVFRAMHSLKGGGAMFGFEMVSEFTHNLETIYDNIRNNKTELNNNIFNITLKCVDHLKTLLETSENLNNDQQKVHETLTKEIATIVDSEEIPKEENQTESVDKTKTYTYYILFDPFENIMDNGTNPLFLVDELASLGDTYIVPNFNKLPDLNDLTLTNCYVSWEIILATEEDLNTVKDVFIFVDDLCELTVEKLDNRNLFKKKAFLQRLTDIEKTHVPIGIQTVQEITKSISSSVAQKVKKVINKGGNGANLNTNSISSIRVASDKLDDLMNLVSELVTTQARLALYTENSESNELAAISENVQKLSRQLRDIAFSIVLVPIETLITRFQRLVRDLSHELGKEVTFRSEGTETELDKTIIESLTDPLMHIIRNSIDHGIEGGEIREANGKPFRGEILLKAFYSGANVVIEISDDGAGIDPDKIKQKAIEKGLINKETSLTPKETYDLLFLPGFSTASNITDVSGRGVGMDVVRQQISKIRGEVEIDSTLGKGTKLILKLPLTLSIIDGLLVKVADTSYVIPLSAVEKIQAVSQDKLFKQYNNLVTLDGEQVPYLYLRDDFKIGKSDNILEQIIVVKYEDKKVGLVVDSIIGEYQAVLKPLGKHYKDQEIFSGATILGDGTIALVLDTNKTVNQFALQNV